MMSKSHVTIEKHACIVCGKLFDTGAILLDTRLRERFERETTTGLGMCPEHQKMKDDGYVALIECDPEKSKVKAGAATLHSDDAYRTGNVCFIRRTAWDHVFTGVDAPARGI